MSQPWATAEVNVELDWSNLDEELVRRLTKASQIAQRAAQRNFDQLSKGAQKSFEDIEDGFDQQMRAVERRSKVAATNVNKELRRIDRHIEVDLDVDSRQATTQFRAAKRAMQAEASARPVKIPIEVEMRRRAIQSAQQSLGRMFSSVAGGVATFSKFAAIAGAATLAVGALVPVVGALGVALYAVGGAAAGLATAGLAGLGMLAGGLIVAFRGMGDAIKSSLDPEKAEEFAAAMEKLSPAAQSVVRGLQAVGKEWQRLGVTAAVQEAMFAGLGPKLAQLTQFVAPLKSALLTVADGFNDGANGALRMINSTRGVAMMNSLFKNSASIGSEFGTAITAIVPGLLAIGSSATRVFAPIIDGLGAASRNLSDFLMKASETGQMDAWFQRMIGTAKQFGAILGELGGILGGVFGAAAAVGGGNPMAGWQASLEKIHAWVDGPGQAALQSFFTSVQQAMGAVVPVLLELANVIGTTIAPIIADLAVALGPSIKDAITAIGEGIANARPQIEMLASAFAKLIEFITPLLPTIIPMLPALLGVGAGIKGVSAAAGMSATALSFFGANVDASGKALSKWGSLGKVAKGALGGIKSAVGGVGSLLSSMGAGFSAAFGKISGVVGKIGPALGRLASGVLPMLRTGLMAVTGAVRAFGMALLANPIGLIIAAVVGLGVALWAFFTKTETGRALWAKIWNGIKAAVSAVWNWIQTTLVPGLQAAWQVIVAGAQFLWQMIQAAWQGIQMAISVVWTIVQGYFNAWMAIFRAIGAVAMWLWNNVMVPAFAAIGAVISAFWAGVQFIWQAFMAALRFVGSVVMWLWNTIVVPAFNAIRAVISAAIQVVIGVFNAVIGAIRQVAQWIMNLASRFMDGCQRIIGVVSGWVSNIIQFFTSLGQRVVAVVGDLWNAVSTSFKNGVDKAFEFVRGLKDKVVSFFSGAGSWLIGAGKAIIEGLVNGIKSMGSAILNAIRNMVPGWVRKFIPGLAIGGFVPAYAVGGLLGGAPALAGGGATADARKRTHGATTKIQPGGYIVNAKSTRANKALLKRIAPGGRTLTGPGSGTSDSISGMWNGNEVARVSKGEYYVPPNQVRGIQALLMGINAGMIAGTQALAEGGAVTADDLINFAKGVEGKPYVWGGVNWGDCSGAVSAIANYATGRDPFASRFATASEQSELAARGFKPGLGPAGSLNVGWFNGGPYGGHTAATLPNGINFEMGGGRGNGQYGGPAAGADDPSFTDHAHLPPEHFGGLDAGAPTVGASGGFGGGGGGSTPIGSGISSSSGGGSGASWGNSGGGSRYNSASDAKAGGVQPVWVENWPAMIGGGGGVSSDLSGGGALSSDLSGGGAGGPAMPDKDLRKGASKEEITAAIVAEGKRRNLSDEDIESAVATALVESEMKNYANSSVPDSLNQPHDAVGSDHDSVGIMQQRQTWGTTAELMDPKVAISKYYDALEKVDGRDQMSVGQRAQAVQRSAYPGRYDERRDEARQLIAAANSNSVPVTSAGNVPVEVTNGSDLSAGTTADSADLSGAGITGAETPDISSTGTPGGSTGGSGTSTPAYKTMPYGTKRANAWASEQNFGAQARDIGIAGLKETFGDVADEFGVKAYFERGFDHLAKVLQQYAERPGSVKLADVVNFNGTNPDETKEAATAGMTDVTETYRQG